mgnify:CR=1 FL=1|jgi:hypothetical protein
MEKYTIIGEVNGGEKAVLREFYSARSAIWE